MAEVLYQECVVLEFAAVKEGPFDEGRMFGFDPEVACLNRIEITLGNPLKGEGLIGAVNSSRPSGFSVARRIMPFPSSENKALMARNPFI